MTTRDHDRGSVTIEFVLILPLLLAFVGLVVTGARVWWARTAVQQSASSAARAASIARTPAQARSDAARLVREDAAQTGLACLGGGPPTALVDVSGFAVRVGSRASVGVTVRCDVPLSDLFVWGARGSLAVSASATSTLDRYRARG